MDERDLVNKWKIVGKVFLGSKEVKKRQKTIAIHSEGELEAEEAGIRHELEKFVFDTFTDDKELRQIRIDIKSDTVTK